MAKRILIAVGGTGGHINPAQRLAMKFKDVEVRFVGVGLTENQNFDHNLFDGTGVSGGKSIPKIVRGISESFKIIHSWKPDLVLGFGSYHSFPILAAAKLCRVPYKLYESNQVTGRVNRLFSWGSSGIIHPYFQSKSSICIPDTLPICSLSLSDARQHYGLDGDKETLLIFGGSLGAKTLNEQIPRLLPKNIQVIHLVGKNGTLEGVAELYAEMKIPAAIKVSETQMEIAYRAATFVICRAGGASIGELISYHVPALLIPYPYASDDHQVANAKFFAEIVKGGTWLHETDLHEITLDERLDTWRTNLQNYHKRVDEWSNTSI